MCNWSPRRRHWSRNSAARPHVISVEEQTDRLAIQVRESETAIEDLHDAIVQLGGRIRMFQPEAMDMETAFMKLTEGVTA